MKTKIQLAISIVVVMMYCREKSFAQFQTMPGGGGRTRPQIQVIGIGNFPNTASVQSVFHINSNLTNTPTFISRGEVFRTNAPITLNTFWRMERGGFARGKIFSRATSPNVLDRDNFSIQADTLDITFHTRPIANNIGQERVRIVGRSRTLFSADTATTYPVRAGNVGIGTQSPLTMLQIGGDVIQSGGYRDWMDVGTLYQFGSDNMYTGYRGTTGDAIINFGNNPGIDGTDRLVFNFTALTSRFGTLQASTSQGLEAARFVTNGNRFFIGFGGDPLNPSQNPYTANPDPGNTVEINSVDTVIGPTNSGLRFTDLNSTSSTITNPGTGVLSVDSSGDVVYVSLPPQPTSTPFLSCSDTAKMWSNAKYNLNGNNFYFEGQGAPKNKVGVGYNCGTALTAKLDVLNNNNDATTQTAGQFISNNSSALARGVLGIGYNSSIANFGVCGHADSIPASFNVGVHGEGTMATDANIGGWFEAGGGNQNVAVLGVAPPSPTSFAGAFQGNVNINGTGTINNVNITSDSIFKNNVVSIPDALSNIRLLQPHAFTFNRESYPTMNFPSGTQYGLIAQQVDSIYPELVSTVTTPGQFNNEGTVVSEGLTFKTLNYNGLIPILTEGVKQLDSTVQQLDSAVAELQNQPQGGVAGNNGQTNYLAKWQNADTLTNSQLYDNGTNVGLGTTSPTTLLHLSKTDGFVSYPGGAGSVSTLLSEQNITNTSAFATLSPSAFQTTINSLDASTSVVNGLTSNTTIPSANSSNASSLQIRGGAFRASHNGTGSINSATGAILNATNRGNGSITYLYGSVNGVNNISDGHVNLAIGGYFQRNNQGTGTVTDAIGVFIDALRYNAGTITNTYGLYIMHQKPPYEVATGTQINNPYGIYQTGVNDYNYFAGNTGIGTSAPSEKLYVAGNIFATGTITQNSDANLKQNITRFTNGMNIIRQLKPYTFNFDTSYHYLNLPAGKQYGMTAQDVEPILPELVTNSFYPDVKDTLGNIISPRIDYKGLNYTAFIPILIQGMKQLDSTQKVQDSTNAALKTRVKELEDLLAQSDKEDKKTKKWNTNKQVVELSSINSIILNQNDPNPFAEQTTITYFIPDEANNVEIIFYTNTGTVIKKVAIHEKGEGSLQIYASNLSDGIYVYSILADEKVIDTKKMMKAK